MAGTNAEMYVAGGSRVGSALPYQISQFHRSNKKNVVVFEANTAPVSFVGEGGWAGTLHPAPTGQDAVGSLPRVLVRPADGGTPLLVPAEMVTRQADGTYFVRLPAPMPKARMRWAKPLLFRFWKKR